MSDAFYGKTLSGATMTIDKFAGPPIILIFTLDSGYESRV
jgi:hypothetical protein